MSNGKIVVMGGDGFIGSEICKLAAETRHEVVSVSHRGRPKRRGGWVDVVKWVAADVFDVSAWRDHLQGSDAVIHTIGTILEQPKKGITFDRINGDSAIVAAKAAREAGVDCFVFLSAALQPPLVGSGYLEAKRRAEDFIQSTSGRWAVLRPSVVFGWERPWTVLPSRAARLAARLPLVGKPLSTYKPLAVEVVATAALRAAMEPAIGGIMDVEMIEKVGRSLLRDWQPRPVSKVA